jgi:hypothetical protein
MHPVSWAHAASNVASARAISAPGDVLDAMAGEGAQAPVFAAVHFRRNNEDAAMPCPTFENLAV